MNMLKFIPHPIIIGVYAALMQLIQCLFPDYFSAWTGFAAWACYFLAGCTPKGGAQVICAWLIALGASIGIIELGECLTSLSGTANIGFPVAVGLVAFCVIFLEKIPFLAVIPILFVGSACFFANSSAGYEKASTIFIVSLLVAQVFGFITVWTRTFYATKFENPAVNDVPPNNP